MEGNCIKTIVFCYTNYEYSKIDGLRSLITVVPCSSNQVQTIEFLKRVGKQFKCSSLRPKSPEKQRGVIQVMIENNALLKQVRGLVSYI